MTKLRLTVTLGSILTLALLAGCGTGGGPPADATIEVISGQEAVVLSWQDIQEMPSYEGVGGRISSVGMVTPPARFKGVTLEDLCGLVGGITAEDSVQVTAKDGYAMTFSYQQITAGDFPTYDPATGNEEDFDGKLWVVVAYEEEDEPISAETDGPFRIALLGSPKLVTDGHWWIKWVKTVEVQQALTDWTLHLEGATSIDVDRGSFETGAAPGCHGTSWTDGEGRTWTGVPLWLLAGQVDDENVHETGAFNDDLAEAGYEIQIIAADGTTVTLDSGSVARNDEILVAYLLDDTSLTEPDWPLRLVGPELEKSDWVGGIERIELILP